MRNKFLILAVFIASATLLGTIGCKKDAGAYTIEGKISDNTFNTPLAGLTLTVSIQNAGAANYINYGTITTDNNGFYRLEIERDQYDKIRFSAEKTNYFPLEFVVSASQLTVGETYIINQATTAKAWARLIFNHTSSNPNAVLTYTKNEGKQGCAECCPITPQNIVGSDTVICINDGNTNYSYVYEVSGTTILDTKTCYTPAFDTGTVIVNY